MSEMEKICKWITDKVNNDVAIVVSLEDNHGAVAIWSGEIDDGEPALGCGDTFSEAVLDAMQRAAELTLEPDGRTCPVCKGGGLVPDEKWGAVECNQCEDGQVR